MDDQSTSAFDLCTAEFDRLAAEVGGIACDQHPLVVLRSPGSLDNWTMPVIELLLVVGAAFCLWHALRRRRTVGDASNLVVWLTGLVALLAIEPIMYFPHWFGVEEHIGLTFVHNQFSVQFMWDRLPLYIVAMYPVFGYVSYVLVQQAGIFARFPVWVGAAATAAAFHVLYEIIDLIGPQLTWWVYNTTAPQAQPSMTFLPLFSLQAFSFSIPFATALLAQLTRGLSSSGSAGLWKAVGIQLVACWPLVMLASVPGAVLRLVGVSKEPAIAVTVWTMIGVAAGVAAVAFWRAVTTDETDPARRAAARTEAESASPVFAVMIAVYLTTTVAFWAYALPAYLAAEDGLTADGHPIGSLPYAAGCFVLSLAVTSASYAAIRRARQHSPVAGRPSVTTGG